MTNIKKRFYKEESDLGAIAELLNACELADCLDSKTSVSELRFKFNDSLIDTTKDLLLWKNINGNLIGLSQISISPNEENDGLLEFHVHPEARDGDLGKQMVAWGEQKMGEITSASGANVKLRSGTRDFNSERITLLRSCGFEIECYLLAMKRSLSKPIPEPLLPKGFTLRHSKGLEDAEAYVEMYNQTFIDDWNYHPLTVEQYQYWLADPNYKSELDLIALASDGTFVASCFCYISKEQNKKNGRKDGFISGLGTRRGFRRQGLGKSMLLAGMQKLKLEGIDTAKLFVNVENPNRAKKLYESVGFSQVYTNVSLIKEI